MQVDLPTAANATNVLVVDDEPLVLRTIRYILAIRGYNVFTAADGEQALRLFREREVPIHLLLTDVVMPGMQGPELARALRRIEPGLRVLFTAGMPHTDDIQAEVFDRGFALLPKPFLPMQLFAAVEAVLATPAVRAASGA